MKTCFHGGAFWDAIPLERIETRREIVSADVLDAWFPPAPSVIDALRDEWLFRTSPPTHAEGLERALAAAFDVPVEAVMAGPGSSALMFLAFGRWLTPVSRVLLVEPTYGEYAHLCETVIGCRVAYWQGPLDLEQWAARAAEFDLAVIVNPNNPTGELIPSAQLAAALPPRAKMWVDEAYLAYTGEPSLAPFAASHPNVAVVRSLSKSHALSGLRAAALFASPETLAPLRIWTPPWWVSLPSQVAAVAALTEVDYYESRYRETHALRARLARAIDLETVEGPANWIFARLPIDGPTAADVVRHCAREGIFLRDAGRTAPSLGERTLRIAVKEEIEKIAESLAQWATMSEHGQGKAGGV